MLNVKIIHNEMIMIVLHEKRVIVLSNIHNLCNNSLKRNKCWTTFLFIKLNKDETRWII